MHIYIRMPRGSLLVSIAVLVSALLLVACGSSAPGATPDSINQEPPTLTPTEEPPAGTPNKEQDTPTPTSERPTEAGAVTPIVVPTPDRGGLSRQELAALLASPTPEAQAVSPSATPEQGAVADEQQATPIPKTVGDSPPPAATAPPAPTPTPTPTPSPDLSLPVGGKVGNRAAEVEGIAAWINSEPLTIQELRGKVVLVDFWTYTCINCIRTFPFLKLWHSRYADDGLVILGVHTPEFEFEKVLDNVVQATLDNAILWPVAQDNDFVTWRNYSNRFWPAKYLIDRDGVVRYTHFGEGAYAETETKIRELLEEADVNLSDDVYTLPADPNIDSTLLQRNLDTIYRDGPRSEVTRELYAGYQRGINDAQFGQGGYVRQPEFYGDRDDSIFFQIPEFLFPHLIYFSGYWKIGPESARHGRDSDSPDDYLTIIYSARSVNAVLTSDSGENYRVRVTMDGENLSNENKGADVTIGPGGESYILVTGPRLYNIVENPTYLHRRTLRMSSDSADFGLFAFTFGVYQKAG